MQPVKQQQGKPSRQRRDARERKREGLPTMLAAIIAAVSAAVLTMACDDGLTVCADACARASGIGDDW